MKKKRGVKKEEVKDTRESGKELPPQRGTSKKKSLRPRPQREKDFTFVYRRSERE